MNNTEVVFENIEQRVLKEIEEAHYAIFVSVAWFTNKRLFKALLEKAKSNCYVSIIIQLDEINSQSGINYDEIKIGRSECFFISKDAELLHDKFCVIDFKKVITGSYNWTYKASQNSENVIVLSDPSIAAQYITRFEQQKAKFAEKTTEESASLPTSQPQDTIPTEVADSTPKPADEHPSILKCSHCREEISVSDSFCKHCGSQQREGTKYRFFRCSRCGNTQEEPLLDNFTNYCTKCGMYYLGIPSLPIGIDIDKLFYTCRKCQTYSNKGAYCPTCGLKRDVSIGVFGKLKARPEYKDFKDFQQCPHCHTPNYFDVTYCRRCGEKLFYAAEDSLGHGWVDLGLSVLWSTETMKGYYPWMNSTTDLTRKDDGEYVHDGKDPASEKWGSKWRMPTKEEFEELLLKCVWEKIVLPDSKINALKVTGPNGRHIILPVTGKRRNFHPEYKYCVCSFGTSTQKNEAWAYRFLYLGYSSNWIEEWRTLTDRQIFEKLLERYKDPPSSVYQNNKQCFERLPEQAMIDEEDRIYYQQESILKEKLNSLNYQVQAQQDSKRRIEYLRNELWLGDPFYKWRLILSDNDGLYAVGPWLIDSSKDALAIRPVADKKWQGKL